MAPAPRALRILVLGRGRVGGSLARAWRRHGLTVRQAPGRSAPSGRGFDVLVLAVPDGAVAVVASRLSSSLRERPLVAHCAGALDLAPLSPLRRRGCPVGSLHPLQALPTPRERLCGAAGLDASGPGALRVLRRLSRAAGLWPVEVSGADRALYHAAAAMASNGLAGLQARVQALLQRCGASPAEATRAALGLMSSALGRPLTGPVARGEEATVRAHLRALLSRSPGDVELYRALARAQLPLARGATAGQRARLRAALRAPGRASSPSRRRAPRAAPAPRRPRP